MPAPHYSHLTVVPVPTPNTAPQLPAVFVVRNAVCATCDGPLYCYPVRNAFPFCKRCGVTVIRSARTGG